MPTEASEEQLAEIKLKASLGQPATMAQTLLGKDKFFAPPHIRLLSRKLSGATLEGGKRIIVSMPPRHGKSHLVSLMYPFYHLYWKPTDRVVLASYEHDFAAEWGKKVMDMVNTHGAKLGMKVRTDQCAAHRWFLESGGGMFTTGIGGPLSGVGANLLLIDDPVKNQKEADSQTLRDATWDWFSTTAYTRLEPSASCVIVMTRWGTDDLVGRLLKQQETGGQKWDYVMFPAIAKEKDILGRSPGEPLWPRRFSTAVYEEKVAKAGKKVNRERDDGWNDLNIISKTQGHRHFASLFQQEPIPEGGGIFKREYFRYYGDEGTYYDLKVNAERMRSRKLWKTDCWRLMSVDTAMTDNTWSDYSVIQIWDIEREWPGKSRNERAAILVDQWREQAKTPVVEQAMRSMSDRYKPDHIIVEERNNGIDIIRKFRSDGIPVRGMAANSNKVARAVPMEIWMESGGVFFPTNTPWLSDFETELLDFSPGCAHDDVVDAAAYALAFATEKDLYNEKKANTKHFPKNAAYHVLGMHELLNPRPAEKPMFRVDGRKGIAIG